MGRILVPIQYKLNGFHAGHIQVIDSAKELGNPYLLVVPKSIDFLEYLNGRIPLPAIPKTLPTMGREVSKLNVKMLLMDFLPIGEEERIRLLTTSTGFIRSLGKIVPAFLTPNCISTIAALHHPRKIRGLERPSASLRQAFRGPDIGAFVHAKFANIMGYGLSITIMPGVVIDGTYGIKAQSAIDKLDPFQKDALKRIPQMLISIQDKLQIGNNEELVKEIELSYRGRPWKLKCASVIEGGLVPGRLETYIFYFRDQAPGGHIIAIEEVRYYA